MNDTKLNSSLDDVNTVFKIPVFYNKNVKKLNESVINDLELVKSVDKDEPSIYDNVFKPSNKPSNKIIEQVADSYTTDIDYLRDTQNLIKSLEIEELNTINNKHSFSSFDLNDAVGLWEEIKGETGFREKYLYIDWSFAKDLNNNASFLQCMSI